jgi:hypothetical protein
MEVQARGKTQRESELGTSAASLKLSRIRDPAGRIIGVSIPFAEIYPWKHLAPPPRRRPLLKMPNWKGTLPQCSHELIDNYFRSRLFLEAPDA